MNEQTQAFIRSHREDDVRRLALKGAGASDVDLPLALQQIAGWQTARHKLPTWAAVEGVIYPPHLNMEQCSSELTARYKASLLSSPSTLHLPPSTLHLQPSTYIDLTGGFGVDFYFMSQAFSRRIYVEQQEQLCDIARHNFSALGMECSVVCGNAADILQQTDHADCIFLDPARRDDHGGRTYALEDCTPNVLELRDQLLQKADCVILKLSPMLDWHKAVEDLQAVCEVHIVSVQNECKELLLVLGARGEEQGARGMLHCVNLLSDGTIQHFEAPLLSPPLGGSPEAQKASPNGGRFGGGFLYEPNASIMKAGCFAALEQQYAVSQLSPNSHLFVSEEMVADFPGRGFRVEALTSFNKRELKVALNGIEQANITVRNFPMSVAELRRKLHLKDGGEVFIFATTLSDGSRMLFICRKIV